MVVIVASVAVVAFLSDTEMREVELASFTKAGRSEGEAGGGAGGGAGSTEMLVIAVGWAAEHLSECMSVSPIFITVKVDVFVAHGILDDEVAVLVADTPVTLADEVDVLDADSQ